MKEKVLITGASGFIGFHIIKSALAAGLEVYAAVRESSSIKHLKELDIHFTYPCFDDITALKKELAENQYHYIIHAAGLTKAMTQDEYNRVNAGYTYNLVKAAEQTDFPLKKLIFFSSLAAIGPLNSNNCIITEQTSPNPATGYGRSKLLAEQKIEDTNVPVITLRPTAVYGPREKDLFIMFRSFQRGIEPYIGSATQQLSFVYAGDLADIAVKALFSSITKATYNITDGNAYSRYDLASIAKNKLHKKTFRFFIPVCVAKLVASVLEITYNRFGKMPTLYRERLNEIIAVNWNCSIDKAKDELGYNPVYNLQRGVAETITWYKAEGWM